MRYLAIFPHSAPPPSRFAAYVDAADLYFSDKHPSVLTRLSSDE